MVMMKFTPFSDDDTFEKTDTSETISPRSAPTFLSLSFASRISFYEFECDLHIMHHSSGADIVESNRMTWKEDDYSKDGKRYVRRQYLGFGSVIY
jgi:hypothetical protein